MEKLHTATASICADTHRLEVELKAPPIRRWARLLVIGAVGMLLLVAIVVMALRIPEFQTNKITFSARKSEVHKLEKLLAEGVQNNQTINCPCRNQVTSWCQMTTFHVYIATDPNASQPFQDALTLTKDEGSTNLTIICNDTDPLKEHICESVLSPVINSKDSRTHLPMGSAYVRPEILYIEITTRIDTYEYEQANSYTYLLSINKTELFNYSDGMIDLLRDMASQFNQSSVSSAEDFWSASQKTRSMYADLLSFGFGMEVNWTAYLQICDPPFCELQFKVSVLNRVLRAMGQVGGITTIVSLGLRFLLWPLLRSALHFSTAPP